jgi:uncharacterized membrane protein SpoIIM required for sporulation
VTLSGFLRDREPSWAELDAALRDARGRPERLGPAGVLRLGRLYQEAAADLALARRRFPADPAVGRLEDLVGRGRAAVYAAEARRGSLVQFLATGYWRMLLARPRPLLLALALLGGSALVVALWALRDPGAALGVVPGRFREAAEPRTGGLGFGPGESAAFSTEIFTNNIAVTFLAFAAGIALGIGSAIVLVYNGALLGALAGVAAGDGWGGAFVSLVAPHGVLELSCIAVSAAAGMRLGWALVDPGPLRRSTALIAEARLAVAIVLGTAPWLVLAGLVEGFVTPADIGPAPALAVGLGLAALYWGLALWRGRAPAAEKALTAAPAPSP